VQTPFIDSKKIISPFGERKGYTTPFISWQVRLGETMMVRYHAQIVSQIDFRCSARAPLFLFSKHREFLNTIDFALIISFSIFLSSLFAVCFLTFSFLFHHAKASLKTIESIDCGE
jgi:hypothetical protein